MARGFFLALSLALLLGACSSALSKKEIDAFEGFGEDPRAASELADAERRLQAGDVEGAVRATKALRDRFPSNVLVHRAYQNARLAKGERDELVIEYERLATASPSALHWTLLSRLQTDPEKGIQLARAAYESDDRFPWAWYTLGWWVGKLGSDPQRAEAALRRALDLHPDCFPALRAYAVLQRDRDAASAVEAIERYLERFPRKREDWILLATLRLGLGGEEVERAEADFRRLLEDRPDDPDCMKGLAMALLERERWREAKEIYLRLRQLYPKDPSSEFNLGVVAELYENDPRSAAAHYQRYLEIGIDEPVLLQSRARLWLVDLEEKLAATAPASAPASKP